MLALISKRFRKIIRLFLNRDVQRFPNDRVGDKLFAFWREGGDVGAPHIALFVVYFSEKRSADEFVLQLVLRFGSLPIHSDANFFASRGLVVDYIAEQNLWAVRFNPFVTPTWHCLSEVDAQLRKLSSEHGGRYDGW